MIKPTLLYLFIFFLDLKLQKGREEEKKRKRKMYSSIPPQYQQMSYQEHVQRRHEEKGCLYAWLVLPFFMFICIVYVSFLTS